VLTRASGEDGERRPIVLHRRRKKNLQSRVGVRRDGIEDKGRTLLQTPCTERGTMADQVLTNQKSILGNQKTILANQKTIVKNQEEIKKNQKALSAILANQKEILKNQKAILGALKNRG
jgi:hypothetical protein